MYNFFQTFPQRRRRGPEWKNREKTGGPRARFWGARRWKFQFVTNWRLISGKRLGIFLRNFQGLRASRGPFYGLEARLVGVQILGVAGGTVAKSGFAVWRWVTLSGSLIFCHAWILNFFTD